MSKPPRDDDDDAGLVWELPGSERSSPPAPPAGSVSGQDPPSPAESPVEQPRPAPGEEPPPVEEPAPVGEPPSVEEPPSAPGPPAVEEPPPGPAEPAAGSTALEAESGEAPAVPDLDDDDLPRVIEALLFLSSDPLTTAELADATEADPGQVAAAFAVLAREFAEGHRGLRLREVGGGFTLATDPLAEAAARRLFSKPRLATLSPAQAETLAIVAYLQPISRPEITRIRGVSADSASGTLLERGLIEESGRSQFGAVLYRTTPLFLKLFGLRTLDQLPDVAQWDPTPEEAAELRDRLLRAGEARSGGGPSPE